jgi:hypothetical protein
MSYRPLQSSGSASSRFIGPYSLKGVYVPHIIVICPYSLKDSLKTVRTDNSVELTPLGLRTDNSVELTLPLDCKDR